MSTWWSVPPPHPPSQPNPNGLRIPVILPKKIDLQDVNLIVRNPAEDLEVRKLALDFQQGSEGNLSCETLRIPVVGTWNHLHAGLSYDQSKLALTDLALEPILDVHRLQIDVSGSEAGQIPPDSRRQGARLVSGGNRIVPSTGRATFRRFDAEFDRPGSRANSEAVAHTDFRIDPKNRNSTQRRSGSSKQLVRVDLRSGQRAPVSKLRH